MQIILQEDIEKLGHRGDVVTVKPGYARNFLLPKKLAVEATAGNLKAIERIRTSLAKKTATEMEAAKKQMEQRPMHQPDKCREDGGRGEAVQDTQHWRVSSPRRPEAVKAKTN